MLAEAVVLALALAASAPDANAGGTACREACAGVRNAALVQGCDGCATGAIDDGDACLEAARHKFDSYVADCPAFAGFCAITHDCVNHCRDVITGARAVCEGAFRSHLRRRCAGGRLCLVTARRARRQCLRKCSPGTTASASPAVVDRCACQQRCIVGMVGGCFADCEDRCEGDGLALAICRRGCRDASCGPLRDACTTERDRPRSSYQRCCMACGNCQNDIDCVTTTSTTTTSSTTTASTSTSTTLPRVAPSERAVGRVVPAFASSTAYQAARWSASSQPPPTPAPAMPNARGRRRSALESGGILAAARIRISARALLLAPRTAPAEGRPPAPRPRRAQRYADT